MNNVVSLFQTKSETLSDYSLESWKEKNSSISQEFSFYNAYEKQQHLDSILAMSDIMYEMIIDLRKQLGMRV